MGGHDPDSRMMRAQQDKDTRQHIEEDETAPRQEAHDSDPESGRAREAAKSAEAQAANEQMNAVFDSNRKQGTGETAAEERFMEDAATRGNMSLIQPGRSRLGRG